MVNDEREKREVLILSSLIKSLEFFQSYAGLIAESDFESQQYQMLFKFTVQARKFNTDSRELSPEQIKDAAYKNMQSVIYMSTVFILEKNIPLANQEDFDKFKESSKGEALVKLGQSILKQQAKGTPYRDILTLIDGEVKAIRDGESNRDTKVYNSEESVELTMSRIEFWLNDNSLGTGIPEVDENLFLRRLPHGFIIIAGRPSAGKTTMLCEIFKHSVVNKRPAILFSLEMSVDQLYMKMAMSNPLMEGARFTPENFERKEFRDRLKESITALRTLPLFVKDSESNIVSLAETAREYSVDHKVESAGLDYIQLANTGDLQDGDTVRVSKCSTVWKNLSKADSARGYPPLKAFALSQYTEPKQPDGIQRKPSNSNLRWSQQLVQDADLILHLYTAQSQSNREGERRVMIYCGKQREYVAEWEVSLDFLVNKQEFSSPKKKQLSLLKAQRVRRNEQEINTREIKF